MTPTAKFEKGDLYWSETQQSLIIIRFVYHPLISQFNDIQYYYEKDGKVLDWFYEWNTNDLTLISKSEFK